MELLRIAVSVSTPVSLLALVVALIYLGYTRRLQHQEKQLKALPPNRRATAADVYLTRYGIDGTNLSPYDKLVLIKEELEKRHSQSKWYVSVTAIAFVVCFVAFIFVEPPAVAADAYLGATGTITQPTNREVVKRDFRVAGTAHNVGKGVHLWLAVGINGRIWPKEGRVKIDNNGEWTMTVFEDGRPGQFEISLWAASPDADTQLRLWLDGGLRNRTFEELRPPPGMKRLARVQELRVTANQ